MALVAPGITRCQLCGELVQEGDDVLGFPAFFPAIDTPMWVAGFSDAAAHRSCFLAWPQRRAFVHLLNMALRHTPGPCIAFGEDGEELPATRSRRS